MKTLIPHKDALASLTNAARTFISSYNKSISANGGDRTKFAIPAFPLWAFAQDFPEKIIRISIQGPRLEEKAFYFPLYIQTDMKVIEQKIIFARIPDARPEEVPLEQALKTMPEIFPLGQRVFRTADVLLERNGWQVYNERWFKLTNSD